MVVFMAADNVDKYTDCVKKKHAVFDKQHVVKVLLWTSYQIFKKKGRLTRPQSLEGVAGKEEGDLFQGELQFLHQK